MNTIQKKGRRRALFAAALAIIGAGAFLVEASPAQAIVTGASATKDCPDGPYNLGDNIPCLATFQNTGDTPATVVSMTEQAPWIANGNPGNGPFLPLSCTIPGGTVISAGSTLPPGATCLVAFNVPVPNDPAFCNTFFRDRVEIDLSYAQPGGQPPLAAGANATNTVFVQCLPSISVDKIADAQSKVTDPVNYSITVCNTSLIPVNRVSVIDTLVGDISANFPATIPATNPDTCATYAYSRVVQAGDPDILVNTVTATYSGFTAAQTATVQDSATTNLFQPGVDVTKNCVPDPNVVGGTSTCTIVVTNTSSGDSPGLINGTIVDSLSGDLLAANPEVVNSTCTAALATGANCTITTARVILPTDPNPVVNTVTVHYNPTGFPNDITDSATDNVTTVVPSITVTKSATGLSKIGDPVSYTIRVCNSGTIGVTRDSVIDAAFPNITGFFAATLAPGACTEVNLNGVVPAGASDPLINTVTATYSGLGASATASASAQTNLFQPGVDVTKSCQPDPVTVGASLVCTIGITNTSSADSPPLTNGTIVDSLYGNLLAANTAVTSNTCTGNLAVGASCQITTAKTVLASDPRPIVNTVTVHYNPVGFTNDITDSASDSVDVESGGEGCTPGYWKQTQHFDSWVNYLPTTKYSAVFGVVITVNKASGKGTITDPTLLQALEAGGGGINALARHSVASLLNSTSGIDADYTTAQVIAIVQDAIAPGGLTIEQAHLLFAAANEQGCPLN